jgi:hypothetical protein
MTFNKTWFNEHKSKLEDVYLNHYVAIYNGSVVDHNKSLAQLVQDFVLTYGEVDVYFGYVGEEPAVNMPMSMLVSSQSGEEAISLGS